MPDPQRKPLDPHLFRIRSFLDYLLFEKRYSSHTINSYTTDLVAFWNFIGDAYGTVEVGDVSSQMVRSWLARMKDERMSSRSLNRKISTLRSYFKYLLREGLVEFSPMTQVITQKISQRLPVFVKEGDARDLLHMLESSGEDWDSLNAKMLISIFYGTGIRLSELIQLKDNQVDLPRAQMKVLGKGNKERVLPLLPEVVQLIREYQELKKKEFAAESDYLLLTKKGKKTLSQICLPPGKETSFPDQYA